MEQLLSLYGSSICCCPSCECAECKYFVNGTCTSRSAVDIDIEADSDIDISDSQSVRR